MRYFQAVGKLGKFLQRPATLDDLDDDLFARWLLWLVDEEKVCERTANGIVGRLRTLWTFLAKRGVFAKRGRVICFPTVQKLPEPEIVPVAWSQEELRRLFQAAQCMPGMVGPFLAKVWWPALLAWFWCTGERAGATLAMTWEHVDLTNAVAVLPAVIRKGKRKSATYRLWPDVVGLLSKLRRPDGKVFPWVKAVEMYYHDWDRLLGMADLPTGRRRKSQGMRVSHATWVEVMGGDASRSLMHSDPMTTRKHYLDPKVLAPKAVDLFKPWSD